MNQHTIDGLLKYTKGLIDEQTKDLTNINEDYNPEQAEEIVSVLKDIDEVYAQAVSKGAEANEAMRKRSK